MAITIVSRITQFLLIQHSMGQLKVVDKAFSSTHYLVSPGLVLTDPKRRIILKGRGKEGMTKNKEGEEEERKEEMIKERKEGKEEGREKKSRRCTLHGPNSLKK